MLGLRLVVDVAQEDLEFSNQFHVGFGLKVGVESRLLSLLVLPQPHSQA